jgi:PucR C-terminal helix-turn-helix domain
VHDLTSVLVARLPAILQEVGDLLSDQHPDYASFLAGALDEVVAAAEGFVRRLVETASAAEPAAGDTPSDGLEQALFEEIGRVHHRQGREVLPLLAAYRTGAAVAWRHVAVAALSEGVSTTQFAALAGALFAAVDRLSEASLRGYVLEQSASASAREAARAALAELLLSERSSTPAVQAAAARAGWPLPQHAAVVVVEPDDAAAHLPLALLEPSTLHLRRPEGLVAIVTDPSGPGRRARLEAVLDGTAAVVGPTVRLERLPASLRLVRLGLAVQRAQLLGEGPLFVDEHLDALIVHRDERLLAALRRRQLAPLAGLSPSAQARLAETLTAWLLRMGDRRATAEDLHVHPQTVRYRLAQLRELFGRKLDDPAFRARLILVLAWGAADDAEPSLSWPTAPDEPGGPGSDAIDR